MKISVIVLSYNSEQHIPELLASLKKTSWPEGSSHELVFVDNASADNTKSLLGEIEKDGTGTVLLNDSNLGFAAGNNIGMKYALENGADYVVLLNDDTVVDPNWIIELTNIFWKQRFQKIGAVQSLLLYWKDEAQVNSWGNYMHFLGFGFAGGNLRKRSEIDTSETSKKITYGSGAAVMYSAEVLKKTGLFDETLDMYHEDADLGLRMRLAGFESRVAYNSVVYHKYEFLKSTASRSGAYKYYLMERNRLYLILKHYLPRTLLLIFPAWLVMEFGTLLFSFVRGFWKEKFRAYAWIALNWKTIMQKRKEERKTRSMSDTEFMKDFVGAISFQEINNPLLNRIANPVMKGYWLLIRKLL